MNRAKMVLIAGICGTLTSISVFAGPLDVTLIGGTPIDEPGYSLFQDPGFLNLIYVANPSQVSSINLAGVNSINLTWAAPAGYMYMVSSPPAGLASSDLFFSAQYGAAGQASSLGSITASSFSVNTVNGTSPLSGQLTMNDGPALDFEALARMTPSTAPFAFTSITISADFSGTGTSQTLNKSVYSEQSLFFGVYTGDFQVGPPPDNLPIIVGTPSITLEPLPTESTPDESSTLALAGMGFAGLLLMVRTRLPVGL